MKNLTRFVLVVVFASVLAFAGNAFALTLDVAKSQGLVGETQGGYLAAVKSADSDTEKLVNQVNQQRKAKYTAIAQKNGTTISAVEKLAAKKAIEETSPGNYVQDASGAWVRK